MKKTKTGLKDKNDKVIRNGDAILDIYRNIKWHVYYNNSHKDYFAKSGFKEIRLKELYDSSKFVVLRDEKY